MQHLKTGQAGGVECVNIRGGDHKNLAGFGREKVVDLGADSVPDDAGVGLRGSGDNVGRH